MATFDAAIRIVLDHEGGLADHPNDPGGITNLGISLRWLRSLEGAQGDLDGDGDVDADDIRAVTEADATRLYRQYFWDPRLDHLRSQNIATKIFDMAVNMGSRRAIEVAQRAVVWFEPRFQVDGTFGPITLAKLNAVSITSGSDGRLHRAIQAEQARFYVRLVHARRSREVFLLGWLNRAYSC